MAYKFLSKLKIHAKHIMQSVDPSSQEGVGSDRLISFLPNATLQLWSCGKNGWYN